MKRWLSLWVVLAACGGGKKVASPSTAPVVPPKDTPTEPESAGPVAPAPVPEAPVAEKTEPAPPQRDQEPILSMPAWQTVGVGQTISIPATAIDPDGDETAVAVTAMPAGAKLDPLTRTITWTPTKKDLPKATFTFHISSLDADGKERAGFDHSVDIAVVKKKQPAPAPAAQSALIETVLTVHDPARLAAVNKDWPLDKMLLRAADLLRATFPPEQQTKLGKNDKKALFQSFLAGLATTHGNPRLDPTSKSFDKKVFGDVKAWKIVAVRPRIDKKWAELRVVYQAVKAPEPVFAMFRFRPTWDTPTIPPEARAYNDKVFLDMVQRHLLPDGKPSDKLLADAKANGKAIDALVTELLAYDDSKTNPWARAGFSALPTEARLGGGTVMNSDGSYRSGDGWAWAVEKPMPTADGSAQKYVDIAFPGFWTEAVASADGKSWVAHCAPKFDPDDPSHAAGDEILCRKALGFVDLPDLVDGKVASGKKDATNLFLEYKTKDEVANLPLTDGRRDNGEENGMTCSQCHVRNFTVRDYGDPATVDPSAGTPKAPNAALAEPLDFQVIPTEKWAGFLLDFMKDQECKGAKAMTQFLGKTGLGCPFTP